LRLSFADAVSMAAGKTPVVELATLRTTEADARVRQARAALLPSLSGSGAWLNRSFNSRSIGISFPGVPELIGPFNNYDARLNAAQTLFDWSSVARVRAAGAQADGSRAERGVTVEGSVLTTALAYVRAVRAQSVVATRPSRPRSPTDPSCGRSWRAPPRHGRPDPRSARNGCPGWSWPAITA